jgi:hypothetical protein
MNEELVPRFVYEDLVAMVVVLQQANGGVN